MFQTLEIDNKIDKRKNETIIQVLTWKNDVNLFEKSIETKSKTFEHMVTINYKQAKNCFSKLNINRVVTS